jgi:hypothetical protein
MNDHQRLVAEALRQGLIEDPPAEFTIAGSSMKPLLQQGDRVRLKPCNQNTLHGGRCYAFKEGVTLVLHRYVATRGEYAIFVGDNMLAHQLIPIDNIIGELIGSDANKMDRCIHVVNCMLLSQHRLRRFIIQRLLCARGNNHEKKV